MHDNRRIPDERELTSCTSTNSPLSPESVFTPRSASKGFLSTSTVGPGDDRKLRIGRVTVGSLEMGEGKPPESRLSGCPLALSDDSAHTGVGSSTESLDGPASAWRRRLRLRDNGSTFNPSKKSVDWDQSVAIPVNKINQNQPRATRDESTIRY